MLTGRVNCAVAAKGIASLSDMLLTPGPELVGHDHLGNGTLVSAQSLVDAFLKDSMLAAPRQDIDITTPGRFLASLLTPAIANERQRHVLLERMGWQSAPRTLQELAEQIGLTD